MDLNQLKSMNPAATAMFTLLADRQRYRKETNIRRLKRTMEEKFGPVDYQQLEETIKAMEAAGLCTFVAGRGGQPNRIIWKYSLRDIGKAAKEGKPFEPGKPLAPAAPKEPVKLKFKPHVERKVALYLQEGHNLVKYEISNTQATIDTIKSLLEKLKV